MKDCGRIQSILGKQKKLWEKTESKHKGFWESTEDLRRTQKMREGTRLWENMEDYGRAERITVKRKHCGKHRIVGEHGQLWEKTGLW